jgi:hypothetical protein
MNALACACEAAGIDDRNETAQQLKIEHLPPIHFSTGVKFNI